jgi:hypothetical protein
VSKDAYGKVRVLLWLQALVVRRHNRRLAKRLGQFVPYDPDETLDRPTLPLIRYEEKPT